MQTGTTTEQNLADFFKGNNMKYEVIAFGSIDEAVKAYESGRCDVFTDDASGLYASRLKLASPAVVSASRAATARSTSAQFAR